MGLGLAAMAQDLDCSERTLRRYINAGTLHGERRGRQELRLSPGEELYVRRHWRVLSALRRALRTEPGVQLAVLFGSMAVGDDNPNSDVDLLIDHATGDLVEVVRLQQRLQDRLGRSVHLVLRRDAERAAPLYADIVTEGRVLVDRGGEWYKLRQQRWQFLRAAAEEEAATQNLAWRGVEEARKRLQA